jgi:hypothetical protein
MVVERVKVCVAPQSYASHAEVTFPNHLLTLTSLLTDAKLLSPLHRDEYS